LPAIKITETVRQNRLRRPLVPSVTKDNEVRGLALHVTSKRGFWAITYQPKGLNPATNRRWGGGVRHELGDAMLMTVSEAASAALVAKGIVRGGGDPHRDRMAARANSEARRSILPTTSGEALATYAAALATRRQPSLTTRRKYIHYANKAVRLMKVETSPLASIDTTTIRLMVETMPGSDAERHDVFGGLNRFLSWAHKQGLVEANACSTFDRHERPAPGKSRDNVPSLEELRTVWNAVEDEPRRDLVRLMLLAPLRLSEAAGLRTSEIDLHQGRIRIGSDRTKNGETHELPLSAPARKILEANMTSGELVFPSTAGKPHAAWSDFRTRLRKRIGQANTPKAKRFVFHDIRRSFVSELAERGYDIDLLDQILGHTRRGVLGVYQRASRMAERARALEAWAGLITGAGESGRVVAFPNLQIR
jgi:integrase